MDHEFKYYASQAKSGDFYEKVTHFFLKTFEEDKKWLAYLVQFKYIK